MSELKTYAAKSGHFVPVWTIEAQTLPEDTDRILDEIMRFHPLSYRRYQRNATIWVPLLNINAKGKMTLSGNTLKVSGNKGPIRDSQVWTRIK